MIAAEEGRPMSVVAKKVIERFISERPVSRVIEQPDRPTRK
jgi:hypothetical protein